jgi:hypothetical protein
MRRTGEAVGGERDVMAALRLMCITLERAVVNNQPPHNSPPREGIKASSLTVMLLWGSVVATIVLFVYIVSWTGNSSSNGNVVDQAVTVEDPWSNEMGIDAELGMNAMGVPDMRASAPPANVNPAPSPRLHVNPNRPLSDEAEDLRSDLESYGLSPAEARALATICDQNRYDPMCQ